ncbi:hypothetical protein CsSME_00049093 [Camellia sinensis var. sinensis]
MSTPVSVSNLSANFSNPPPPDISSNAGTIAAGIIMSVVVLVVIVIISLAWARRRRRRKRAIGPELPTTVAPPQTLNVVPVWEIEAPTMESIVQDLAKKKPFHN